MEKNNKTDEQLIRAYKKRRFKNMITYGLAIGGITVLVVMLSLLKSNKVDAPTPLEDTESTPVETVYSGYSNIAMLLTQGKPVILALGAEWCEPCKRLDPLLEEIQKENKDKVIIKIIDVDKEPQFASQYPLTSLPTQIMYTYEGIAYNPKTFIGVNNFKMYKENSDDKEPSLTMHQGEMTKSEVLTVLNDMQSSDNKLKEPVTQEQLEKDEKMYSTQLHSDKYMKKHGFEKPSGNISEEDSSKYETIRGGTN